MNYATTAWQCGKIWLLATTVKNAKIPAHRGHTALCRYCKYPIFHAFQANY